MKAIVYNADIYCVPCATNIMARLDSHTISDNGDSCNYPQGPYGSGGGEADYPCYCGACGEFLENPLTTDGIEYVREVLSAHTTDEKLPDAVRQWRAFYKLESESA